MVASVTTIEGIRTHATSAPLTRAHQRAHQAGRRARQRRGQPHARENSRGHAADRELRAHRNIDLPGEDHQRTCRGPRSAPAYSPASGRARLANVKKPGATTASTAPMRQNRDDQRKLPAVAFQHQACPSARARIFSCVASARDSDARDRARVHDRDPVAHPQNLRQLRRNHDDRHALLRQIHHDPVDLRFRPDVHTLRRLVQNQHLGVDGQPTRERPPSADCRRRAIRSPRRCDGVLMRSRSTYSRASSRSRVMIDQSRCAKPRPGSPGWRSPQSASPSPRRAAGGPPADSRCRMPDRVRRRADAHRVTLQQDLALIGRRQAEQRLRQFRPARSDQSRDPKDLARAAPRT